MPGALIAQTCTHVPSEVHRQRLKDDLGDELLTAGHEGLFQLRGEGRAWQVCHVMVGDDRESASRDVLPLAVSRWGRGAGCWGRAVPRSWAVPAECGRPGAHVVCAPGRRSGPVGIGAGGSARAITSGGGRSGPAAVDQDDVARGEQAGGDDGEAEARAGLGQAGLRGARRVAAVAVPFGAAGTDGAAVGAGLSGSTGMFSSSTCHQPFFTWTGMLTSSLP